MKKLILLLLLFAVAIFTVACGADDTEETTGTQDATENQQEAQNNQDEEVATEVVVEHELGTTTVPVNPEKVVVFDFGTLDTLDYLGVDVAALPKGNIPEYLTQFDTDAYENAGTLFEPDFETLAHIDPDLIIISGRTQEAYEELSNLAPTIFMGVDTARYIESFEANITLLGEIFTKQTEVEDALGEITESVASLQALVSEDEPGLIILTNDGSLSAFGPGSRFGIIHDEFGISPVDEGIESATHGQSISFEYVTEMNPHYLFVMDRNAVTGGEHTASSTLDNDLINQTIAAEEDQIVYLTPDYWYLSSGGIVSVTEMIHEIAAALQ
ncbi:iron complex transport system substrate-binding protein [Natronobacillus azotifigens]|uniref:Siderophore ABC transporter substrate-binding protein n=1 Tax=Natronobacillus azotifigens TaxID=472978 RepID=A0A9J6RCP8_9BACI|nr:siderophore ABC transporter substrate-binding protein [Natronobacillus azotifigens]MCZ0703285.1 siderophore ABC transporter substrate-binding protein [Natronobacillus azotifigens]